MDAPKLLDSGNRSGMGGFIQGRVENLSWQDRLNH